MSLPTSPLLTDLYMLTMLQGFYEQNMEDTAVFEFFVRELPPNRNFLVAAGLEDALTHLLNLQFQDDELQWLSDTGRFKKDFIDYLGKFRFRGDVHAMPEGTVFFENEPILRITAPIPQAQLLETRLINLLHFQTTIASKASRCVLAAPDKLLVDFGLRRSHGAEAGLLAARACYLSGFAGTSTVLAGKLFDIPIFGTMAHSFVLSHDDESEAFEHFAYAQPNNIVLLIDTYDTEKAAEKVVALAPGLEQKGLKIKAVRLDSGDLAEHARKVRHILDRGNLSDVNILASGNLDEHELNKLHLQKAPIDGFGVGTRMITSSDAPYLDCAYKLVEYAGKPRRKLSEGKATLPGRKQVFRQYTDDKNKLLSHDIISIEGDIHPGKPLLEKYVENGQRIKKPASLSQIRAHAVSEIKHLPSHLRNLSSSSKYPVQVSEKLLRLSKKVDKQTQGV